jgi:hypothetical protein
LFKPAEHLPDGDMAGGLDFRPHLRAASGGQQAHTLRIRKRQIKGRYACVDPLADMLACFRNSCAIQFLGILIKDCPTYSIRYDGSDLPGIGNGLQPLPSPLTGRQLTDRNALLQYLWVSKRIQR